MLKKSVFLRGRVRELLIVVVIVTLIGGGYRACRADGANSPKLFARGVVSGPADDLSPVFGVWEAQVAIAPWPQHRKHIRPYRRFGGLKTSNYLERDRNCPDS